METGLYKLVHRTDRCDLSLFQLGLRLVNYLAVRGANSSPESTNN